MDAQGCNRRWGYRYEVQYPASESFTINQQQKTTVEGIEPIIDQNSQDNYLEKTVASRRNNARNGENTPLHTLIQTEKFIAEIHEANIKIMEAMDIQDKLIEKIYKKKAKNTSFNHSKLRLIHNFTVIVIVIILLIQSINAMPVDRPALFNKHERMDKLIMKNQIGYHFKKVVREVSQELFVSRRVDVSTLFLGVQVLKQTSEDLAKFCSKVRKVNTDTKFDFVQPPKSEFTHIKYPELASFAEAKARCEARQMQLPEIYSLIHHDHLSTFLRTNKVPKCFAGLIPDFSDATFRFIATGAAIWRTPHKELYDVNGARKEFPNTMDDFHVKFMYGDDNKLYARYVVANYKLGDQTYRDNNKLFPQVVAPIICQAKWDGLTHDNFKSDNRESHGIKVNSYTKRSTRYSDSGNPNKANSDEHTARVLKEYCASITSRSSDLYIEMSTKLKNLLALVDISVHLENSELQRTRKDLHEQDDSFFNETMVNNLEQLKMNLQFNNHTVIEKPRKKRFAFLAKFIFTTGVKLIWNLFGFVQQMRLERKIDKIEMTLSATQKQSKENYEAIQNMSLVVSSNSIAISQLQITTKDLGERMVKLENKVDSLIFGVESIADTQDDMIRLALVNSLIDRVEHSMDSGYGVLKDIIHSSLLGQTSPLLLPTDQIELVQNEVRKVSTSIFDTDFAKMQSIIVSDPSDPHYLLIVINVAALSRKEGELVKLIPLPQYEGSRAYQPTLDYDTIIIDQLSQKYFVLNEQEEYDCLFNRCYISDVERTIDQRTCGIPQLFDQQMDACVFEETPADEVFIKPMLPDGIIFAFKDEVSTQLFCKDNSDIGAVRKLDGSGIMQLPNGCTLSVTDKHGKNTKVRGQPLYRIIDADDLTLVMNGPLAGIKSYSSENATQKKVTPDELVSSHLSPVFQQVNEVDAKVEHHSSFIWGMIGVLAITTAIIIAIILVIYKRSQKFFGKVRYIREKFDDIAHQVIRINNIRHRVTDGLHRPHFTHLRQAILHPPTSIRNRLGFNAHAPDPEEEASIYVSMHNIPQAMDRLTSVSNNAGLSGLKGSNQCKEVAKVPYPDLSSPLESEEDNYLEEENKKVEDFCKKYRKDSPNA